MAELSIELLISLHGLFQVIKQWVLVDMDCWKFKRKEKGQSENIFVLCAV